MNLKKAWLAIPVGAALAEHTALAAPTLTLSSPKERL